MDEPTAIKILLVEHNPGDARLLREMLADPDGARFELTHVVQLGDAFVRLDAEHFDAVLLDLSLPDSVGLETLTRTHTHAPGAPIIVLTGLDDEMLGVRAVQIGAQDYLVKGQVERSLLVRAVRYAIERKRAEEQLRESETRYRLLAENASDFIWTMDMDLNLTYVSPAVTRLRGYTVAEVMAQTLDESLTPASFEYTMKVWLEEMELENAGTADPRRSRIMELEYNRKDGSTVWAESRVTALRDVDGKMVGILGVTRDISERKRAEDALRESEARYRLLAENATDVIWAVDMNMRPIYMSPSITRLLGYGVEEAMARTMQEAYAPASFELAAQALAEELARERTGQASPSRSRILELDLNCKDGSTVPAEVNFAFLRDANGQPQGILAIARDITERKRAEESLQQRNRELALLNRAGQTFNSTLDLDQVLMRVLEELYGLMHTAGAFWLTDPETAELVCRQASGPYSEIVRDWRLPSGRGIAGWAAQQGASVIVADAQADARHLTEIDQRTGLMARSMLCVPLKSKEQVIGVLQLLDTAVGRFSAADLALVESLAATATIAIENARLYESVRALSLTDGLTELYNRRGFVTLAEQALKLAHRTKRGMVLLFADLDGLKQINDTLGHSAGDQALIATANILRETFREADIVARLGGDEFVVLALETAENGAVLTRLYENLTRHNTQANRGYNLSLSIGVARYDPEHACSVDELLAQADALMYEEKRRKREVSPR